MQKKFNEPLACSITQLLIVIVIYYLNCWRVDVFLGVHHGEEHLHKTFGLILEEDIHLTDHGLLQLVHRLVLIDEGQYILGQSCRVCITPK